MIVWVVFIPRVGSSMLMRMLARGGMDILQDREQPTLPAVANPNGYYESNAVKSDPVSALRSVTMNEYAVKIPARVVLPCLEAGLEPTHVLFPTRPIAESQQSWADAFESSGPNFSMDWQIATQNLAIARETVGHHNIPSLDVPYHDVLADAPGWAQRLDAFLDGLDVAAMAPVPDPSLCHYGLEVGGERAQ